MNPGDSKTPYDRTVERRPAVVVVPAGAAEGCSSCHPCAGGGTSGEPTIVRLPGHGLLGFGIAVIYPTP